MIKLNGNTAIISRGNIDTDDDISNITPDFIIIKSMMNHDTPNEKDWFQIKPGIMGKIVGACDDGYEVDDIICRDIVGNFPDVNGDLLGCKLYRRLEDVTPLYLPGYHRCKIEGVEYETYKLEIE